MEKRIAELDAEIAQENNMLRLSRRQLLKTTAISTALAATPSIGISGIP